jgi:glycosyltransferase involved in cell wall biosynthesis
MSKPDRVALVFGEEPDDLYRAGRTLRTARDAGWTPHELTGRTLSELADAIDAIDGPVWLIRAGAWRRVRGEVALPPPSATGLALCAIGWPTFVGASDIDDESAAWQRLYDDHGGDLSQAARDRAPLPKLISALIEKPIARAIAARLREGATLATAWADELHAAADQCRVIRYSAIDVLFDRRRRVLQIITSLQRGGAERVALDLARVLPAQGLHCRVAAVGSPTRAPFPAPPGTCDLSQLPIDRAGRVDAAVRLAAADGTDVVHAHLLDRADLAQLSAAELPTVATVHNARRGWQAGQGELEASEADLVVGCAQAVEQELHEAGLTLPLRTVWNGIEPADLARRGRDPELRRLFRQKQGIATDDVVLLCLANPRPQKRMPRLPAILAAVRERMPSVAVRLLIAGEASRVHASAQETVAETEAEITRLRLSDAVIWLGAVDDVAEVLSAADVLVSASEFEGLSLAHLEAAAAGLPVVSTDVGGTAELAADKLAIRLVPVDAGPGEFATAICEALSLSGVRTTQPLRCFSLDAMSRRYAWLYPRALAARRSRSAAPRRDGLWLVTNNFSTGGAQSSARRLLVGLFRRGIAVRAAVLQEDPDNPTPGRQALISAGIPVVSLPPPGAADAAVAMESLLGRIDADPPQSVLFWNVIPEYKILLADALIDFPVFDVSPGEMYFASLEKYFARPRAGLPYRAAADYSRRLAGVIVKYSAEREQAASLLGTAVHVIPNGVPVAGGNRQHHRNGRLVIGTAARISPQKRLEDLLAGFTEAHSRLPPYVLRIAGAPEEGAEEYAASLREQSRGLPVEWIGEAGDVGQFLEGLDLFAQVSEPAGCPNASLEALAAGLPVIVTDGGGAVEQVVDGVTGRLVPRRDPAALAGALIELAGNPALRDEFAQAGQRHVATHFSLDRMLDDYARVCLG